MHGLVGATAWPPAGSQGSAGAHLVRGLAADKGCALQQRAAPARAARAARPAPNVRPRPQHRHGSAGGQDGHSQEAPRQGLPEPPLGLLYHGCGLGPGG